MTKSGYCLIAGGVISAFISIVHIFFAFMPQLYKYVDPGQGSGVAQLTEQGSSLITIASIILALIFAIWAIYAFSGAGLLTRLPLLRTFLIVIAVIYILRSLFLPSEINLVLYQGYPFRFVVFSAVSLVAGLLYLIGVWKPKASLSSNKKS